MCILHLFCAQTTPAAGICLQFEFQYNYRQITAGFSAKRLQQLLLSDILLFWCFWFKYRFINVDLVAAEEHFAFFSRVGDCVSVKPSARLNSVCVMHRKCNKSRHRP